MSERPGGLRADLDAMAQLGWGPDRLNALTKFQPGQFSDFMALDRPLRIYVLKVLGNDATEADHEWFSEQPAAQVIAEWMLGLPAFQGDYDDEEEE